MARYCKRCGSKLNADGKCPKCGLSGQITPAKAQADAPAENKKKKGGLWTLLVLLSAAFLIVCALQYFGVVDIDIIGEVLSSAGLTAQKSTETTDNTDQQVLVDRPDAEKYLTEIGSVTDKKNASDSTLLTEAEAFQAFASRGFTDLEITTGYDSDGSYRTAYVISGSGTKKHPSYEAIFRAEDGEFFIITLIGNQFFANPVSFMEENRWDKPHILSETGTYLAYDGKTNAFYTLTPDSDTIMIRKVERIDIETLSAISAKEVEAG